MIQLTPHQTDAVNKILDVLRYEGEFTLMGNAGTGKTTIMKDTVNRFLEDLIQIGDAELIHVCAPTNKAASVLKQKGLPDPKTIHSMAYQFQGINVDIECPSCDYRDAATVFKASEARYDCPNCGTTTRIADSDRRELAFAEKDFSSSVVVVDEASMVGYRLARNLRQRCPRILWCGDHGQLPPVGDSDAGIFQGPHFELTEIHRQAKGNAIIDFAYRLRDGYDMRVRPAYDDNVFCTSKRSAQQLAEHSKIDVFICHRNVDRVAINMAIRARMGLDRDQPQKGDKICLLSNDHRYGLYNGDIAEIVECGPYQASHGVDKFRGVSARVQPTDDCWAAKVKHPMTGHTFTMTLPKCQFNQPKSVRQSDMELAEHIEDNYENVMWADYGYAITGHKSQGSQWGNVGVLVPRYELTDAEKWNYTVATRAAENLILFGV